MIAVSVAAARQVSELEPEGRRRPAACHSGRGYAMPWCKRTTAVLCEMCARVRFGSRTPSRLRAHASLHCSLHGVSQCLQAGDGQNSRQEQLPLNHSKIKLFEFQKPKLNLLRARDVDALLQEESRHKAQTLRGLDTVGKTAQ